MNRFTAIFAIAIFATANAGVANAASGAFSRIESPVLVELAQAKKDETVKEKVKRIWREWTGYKFSVGCPALLPLTRTTCTTTGKNREEARAKCQSSNPFCLVQDASK